MRYLSSASQRKWGTQPISNSASTIFRPGKPIEDAIVDELGEGALGGVMQTRVAVARIVGIILKAMARKGMQAERQVEVLRRGPERLVAALFVAVALGGIGDDHGAFEPQGRTAL